MSYLGKTYTYDGHDKFDQFLASVGVQKEAIDAFNAEKSSQTLVKNGDTYTLTLSTKGTKPVSFQPGVEFDDNVYGRQCKSTVEVNGDTITQTQRFSDGYTVTYKKKFTDNKLVVEATNSSWDGVAYRYYSA